MARIKRRSLFIATESSFATDPSANGSGYSWVPAMSLSGMTDALEQLETNYHTGRNYPTAPIAGPDAAELQVSFPLIGLATAGGDAQSPAAADWLHYFLLHIFGTTEALTGDSLTGSSTSTFVTQAENYGAQRLVPLWASGVASGRTQWGFVSSVATLTHTVSPLFSADPTGSAIAYASRQYRPSATGGNTIAAVFVDDELTYTLLGGRVTAFSITAEAGKMVTASATIRFDSKTLDAGKSSLPNIGAGPAVTPIKLATSPLWIGSTMTATRSMTLDFGLNVAEVASNENANGRSGHEVISFAPTLTVEPLRSNDHVNLKRAVTQQPMLLQLGVGTVAGGVLNSMAVHFNSCYASEVSDADENGRTRNSITLVCADNGQHAAAVDPNFFTLARA